MSLAEHQGPEELASLDVEGALDLLLAAAEVLQRAAHGQGTTSLTDEDTLHCLRQIQRLDFLVGTVKSELTRHAYQTGRRGKRLIEGIGMVDVHRSDSRRRWDERGVCQAVVDVKMTERGTGEFPAPWEVVEWLLEAGAMDRFRTTALRSMGLNPDDFCEYVKGKPTVGLPPLPG